MCQKTNNKSKLEVYYRGLLKITDLPKLLSLIQLAEAAKPDWEMKALVDDAPPDINEGIPAIQDEGGAGGADADALRRAHAMCVHVLLGGEGGLLNRADMGREMLVEVDAGTVIKVHFDRCSHSSGHQRGYVRCLRQGPVADGGRPACFRYMQVRKRGTQRKTAGYLAAWAFECNRRPATWLKQDHKQFEPDEEFALQSASQIR